jgi:hypothetical protein
MTRRGWVAALLLLGRAACAEDPPVQTVTGFRVPEYDDQNRLKSQLFGDFASVLPDGIIEITQLKIDFYDEGEVVMTVTAPRCRYDQKKGNAQSDSDLRITRKNMVVTGKGFSWSGRSERFEIYREAKVVLQDAGGQIKTGAKE